MVKVLSVFGTRPETIKMAPLIKELERRKEIESIVCVTGQHREMLDQVLQAFDIHPNYDLNVMKKNQTLSSLTQMILQKLDEVMAETAPDLLLVHGDTTSAFAAALCGYYHKIPVGHVEAGLRTYNKYSPYPEEVNRQFISLVADMNFAPTEQSRQNLIQEGKDANTIYVTGNTAIDALQLTVRSDYEDEITRWAAGSRLIVLTAHRRENLGEPMKGMFRAIRKICEKHRDVKVVYPVHLNPMVVSAANEVFGGMDSIRLIQPLEVVEFHNLLARSYMILTDSGGIQEEAPSLHKPVIVLRDTTERPEGVQAGTLRLAGTKEADIFRIIDELLCDKKQYDAMCKAENPYGDGQASVRIADAILHRYNS